MERERHFSDFRLDLANEQLWQGEEEIRLRRKTFQVLCYLVACAGQLVTKEALLNQVWAEVVVSDSMPSICVAELRKALGDNARSPSLIETVHGRGYRFIAQLKPAPASGATSAPDPMPLMVGRDEELAQISELFARANQGSRQVVFVTGEPGIGKTTFVQSFISRLERAGVARIARGQCVKQYGAGEPYMPVLEALTRLAQEPGAECLVEILRRVAPSWLAQMPLLLTPEERASLLGVFQGATPQRILREMAGALEALAAETPLILLLEDLHWSDFSTLELISTIARRVEPAHLLIIGTYRPVEMLVGDHPLREVKKELDLHRQCVELRLELLSEENVTAYLDLRFSGSGANQFGGLAPAIFKRTEGNPLFIVNVVDYIEAQGPLFDSSKVEAPRTVRQMIERNLERLTTKEQNVLGSASVAGAEFSATAVAAALERQVSEVDDCCAKLSRSEQFIRSLGGNEWPDGTLANRYRFLHALYQEVIYARGPVGQLAEWHRRIAKREEAGYAERAAEIAAELAYHFGRCGDKARAQKYLQLAAERAVARRAYREAGQHYRDAIAISQALPESSERDGHELMLQLALGGVLHATRGTSSVEAGESHESARLLAKRIGDAKSIEVLYQLSGAASTRGDQRGALAVADQFLEIATGTGTPAALTYAHDAQARPRFLIGDLTGARKHFDQALKQYCEEDFIGAPVNLNPGLASLVFGGYNEWMLGHPEVALHHVSDAVALARRQNSPYVLAVALAITAVVQGRIGNFTRMLEQCDEALKLAMGAGFPQANVIAKIGSAWARAQMGENCEAVESIREGLRECDALKFHSSRAEFLRMLSETQARAGATRDAFVTVELALQANSDELVWRPDALRVRGELGLHTAPGGKAQFEIAKQDFREAIEMARKMGARSLELRATTSLARILDHQGFRDEARGTLSEIYAWFTEGFETADLKEAKALLEKLATEPATLTDQSDPAQCGDERHQINASRAPGTNPLRTRPI